jgi:hypothetical protein
MKDASCLIGASSGLFIRGKSRLAAAHTKIDWSASVHRQSETCLVANIVTEQ